MPSLQSAQAIVLAGGTEDKSLFPLCQSTAKALLPVANRPLLSYPLQSLHTAGLRHAYVVVSGERAAASVQAWLQHEYAGKDMQCEVVCVPDGCGTADALRAVAPHITAPTCIVLSGDLVTDQQIDVLVATHQLNAALATLVLFKRKVPPSADTKPGKAPKNVDYVGLDPHQQHLLFYASSPETLRDLKVPLSVVRRHGSMSIASDLANAHLYVLNKSVLDLIVAEPKLVSIRKDLLPYLAFNQRRLAPSTAGLQGRAATTSEAGKPEAAAEGEEQMSGSEGSAVQGRDLPGADYMDWSHTSPSKANSGGACVHVSIVQPGTSYCARVSDASHYGEVNREAADSSVALHLTGHSSSPQHDNVVPASTSIGQKATVASGCVLGESCTLGDKSSIKRSVLGKGCRLGTGAKVINSVLQDGVVIGDGCMVQNSIVCSDVQLKDKAMVKDCMIEKSYTVAGDKEYSGEVLAKQAKA